jgi:hypothetical protein
LRELEADRKAPIERIRSRLEGIYRERISTGRGAIERIRNGQRGV